LNCANQSLGAPLEVQEIHQYVNVSILHLKGSRHHLPLFYAPLSNSKFMTTPPNIDRFNKITLLTLDTLYQAFPVPKTLDVATLALETLPPDTEFDDSFQSIEVAIG
jgi:hypothetical protein